MYFETIEDKHLPQREVNRKMLSEISRIWDEQLYYKT